MPDRNLVFLGRQPVFDIDRETFGYELLYRDGHTGGTAFDGPDDATRQVMERSLLHWGMEQIIGNRFGLINAAPSLVLSGLHRSMPPEGIIFEIVEDEPLADGALDQFVAARRDGYHFALDNVTSIDALDASRLLPLVSIVKIEPTTISSPELDRMVDLVHRRAPGVLIAAEKIETREDFGRCVGHGFDLFQGYFFAEPEVLSRSARPASSASALALMSEMQRRSIDIGRAEELVSSDPTLAYRLLSVVNSSAFGLARRVTSVRHAIVMLGLDQVRHLATLLAMSAASPVDEELITLGAVRGRLASSLAPDADQRDAAFTAGLLSVTDVIFSTPMEELVADLPLSDDISRALVDRTGPIGAILEVVEACERDDVESAIDLLPDRGEQLSVAYAEAIAWAESLRARTGALSGSKLVLRPPTDDPVPGLPAPTGSQPVPGVPVPAGPFALGGPVGPRVSGPSVPGAPSPRRG